jgi:hypothetical protein
MTFLKWEKTGVRTWYGAAGSYRYTIAKNLDGRYYVERLGKKWAVANTLQSAKDAAEIDADKRHAQVMALPDYDPKTFCQPR